MRPRVIDLIVLMLGVLLIVAGQYTIAFHESVTVLIITRLGDVGRSVATVGEAMFPASVTIGIAALVLGALLVALGIGQPPQVGAVVRAPGAGALPRRATMLIMLAAVLAIGTATPFMCARSDLWPLVVWISAALIGFVAMREIDGVRGTRLGNPFSQREWISLVVLVAADLLLVGHDLTHWVWSGFPDESDFFAVAKSIGVGTSQRALFSEHGVFEYHPVLSSYYQSLFMRVFGMNAFGWRMSSAAALAMSLPFLYLIGRELWTRRVGFVAAIFFGSAQLSVGFSHFGYNNVQVYPIVIGALGLWVWAHHRGSLSGYYLVGCITGAGFYTFYPARFTPLLLLLLMWSVDGFPLSKANRRTSIALAFGMLIVILPWLTRAAEAIRNMLIVASLTGAQSATGESIAMRMVHHWLWSMVYGLWYPSPHHLFDNPIVDPLSAVLAVIGFWICMRGVRRSAGGRFLVVTYAISALVVGSTSPHFRPPLTRLLFLSPFTALLAAIAMDQLLRRSGGTSRARLATAVAGVLVAFSVWWNINALHHSVYDLHHGYGAGTTTELVRTALQLPAACHVIYIQRVDAENSAAEPIADEYGMRERFEYFRPLTIRAREVLQTIEPPFVVFTDLRGSTDAQVAESLLAQRFPAVAWQATDAGRPWSLPYFYVPAS